MLAFDPAGPVRQKYPALPTPLPIDDSLPDLVSALEQCSFAVVEAAPGAGKTTRIPVALEQAFGSRGQILVTEPRRLAARLAASFVAKELGSALGHRVGYSVRFENKTSKHTRIKYLTEGVLLQQLRADPLLRAASVVVLDEFHERHLQSDQLLAMLKALIAKRPELKLVVMSATLDAEPVAEFLEDCERLRVAGRSFPVEVRYNTELEDRPLDKRVSLAVKQLLRENAEGDILVFLPGIAEIRRCYTALEPVAKEFGILVHALHGQLPLAEQAKAIEKSHRLKVVLSTNVAESSVTVEGVTRVIDSGLVRLAQDSPWTGQRQLLVQATSQASAIQRAGRAGRTAPGVVVRLFSEADFERRPAFEKVELQRLQLTELILDLKQLGTDVKQLAWLEAPPANSVQSATTLLQNLGALTQSGELTPVGRQMTQLPLPPRTARVFLECVERGIPHTGALVASLLSEGDLRLAFRRTDLDIATGSSDLEEQLDLYLAAEASNFAKSELRAMDLDARKVDSARRVVKQLLPFVPHCEEPPAQEVKFRLRRALLKGFFDCVARRRSTDPQQLTRQFILANGQTGTADESSVVRSARLVVVLAAEDRKFAHPSPSAGGKGAQRSRSSQTGTWLKCLSAIDAEWLFEDFPDRVTSEDVLEYDTQKRCVMSVGRLCFGSVVLEESRIQASPGSNAARLLLDAALSQRTALFGKRSEFYELFERVKTLKQVLGEECLHTPLPETPEQLLAVACQNTVSLRELENIDFESLFMAELSQQERRLLDKETPTHITLPSGRRLKVHYESGKTPWIASRIQDFFGVAHSPKICQGRLPLTLHLLAPNGRAAQVSSDLESFWTHHYAEVRKELRRRYAKHHWPEDGRNAEPPPPRPRRDRKR